MYVTNKQNSLFVYYLEEDDMLIDIYVPFSKEFTVDKISKFNKFYFSKMLPYLSSQYHLKLLVLNETNKIL